MGEDRFISFLDTQGTEHTYRLTDIQSVGVGERPGAPSYVRAFGFPMTIPEAEAVRVRAKWLEEG